jgi:hypothetical protein
MKTSTTIRTTKELLSAAMEIERDLVEKAKAGNMEPADWDKLSAIGARVEALKMKEKMDGVKESRGHLGWTKDGEYEFYAIDYNSVHRAHVSAVFDIDKGVRIGRWECTKSHWDRFFDACFAQNVI